MNEPMTPREAAAHHIVLRLLDAHGCHEGWMDHSPLADVLNKQECDAIIMDDPEWWELLAEEVGKLAQYTINEQTLLG